MYVEEPKVTDCSSSTKASLIGRRMSFEGAVFYCSFNTSIYLTRNALEGPLLLVSCVVVFVVCMVCWLFHLFLAFLLW